MCVSLRRGGYFLSNLITTIGQEVTLVLGGLKGLVKDFRPLEGMYCVEVLVRKVKSKCRFICGILQESFQYKGKMMTLRIRSKKGDVNPEPKHLLHTMHTLKNFSRT